MIALQPPSPPGQSTKRGSLHSRMTDLTPEMLQTIGRFREVTAENIIATTNDQIRTRWKRRGIYPGQARDQSIDPPGQNWTELEEPGTPQQNNFANTRETSLWYLYSPQCIICGEKLENRLYSTGSHEKREELDGSSRPRNKGSSEPAPVRVWREIRAMGQSTTSPLPNM